MTFDDEAWLVYVHEVRYTGGTIALGYGETVTGELVTFAGEPRALHALAEAISYGEVPLAHVPTFAILRMEAAPIHG